MVPRLYLIEDPMRDGQSLCQTVPPGKVQYMKCGHNSAFVQMRNSKSLHKMQRLFPGVLLEEMSDMATGKARIIIEGAHELGTPWATVEPRSRECPARIHVMMSPLTEPAPVRRALTYDPEPIDLVDPEPIPLPDPFEVYNRWVFLPCLCGSCQ